MKNCFGIYHLPPQRIPTILDFKDGEKIQILSFSSRGRMVFCKSLDRPGFMCNVLFNEIEITHPDFIEINGRTLDTKWGMFMDEFEDEVIVN